MSKSAKVINNLRARVRVHAMERDLFAFIYKMLYLCKVKYGESERLKYYEHED